MPSRATVRQLYDLLTFRAFAPGEPSLLRLERMRPKYLHCKFRSARPTIWLPFYLG